MHPNPSGHPASLSVRLNQPRTAAALLALLIFIHFLTNLAWLAIDDHVIRIDEEFHAAGARDYYYALVAPEYGGLRARLAALASIESPYPPLLHILGALLALFLGYSRDVIVLAGSLSFAFTLIGVYRLGRVFFDRGGALFATTIVSLIPILFAGARYMALENLITALTVWAVYALYRSQGFQHLGWSAFFGLLNGAAILTKPNAFVYYLPVSALVFAFAVAAVAARREDRAPALGRLLFNAGFSVALAILIFLPWYALHRDYLEHYWLHEHKSGETPFSFLETREVEPAAAAPPADPPREFVPQPASILEEKGIPALPAAEAPEAVPSVVLSLTTFFGREWSAYPIALVNSGAFLPLTLLGLLGLPLLFLLGAPRRGPALMVLVWLLGAYILMTLAFRYTNPRYIMPMIAPLGLGAAALVLFIPRPGPRRLAAGILVGALVWQFLVISTGLPLLPGRLDLPILKEHRLVTRYLDHGLVLFKKELVVGTYCFKGPTRGDNYVERVFQKMRDTERAHGRPAGETVPYLALWRQNNFGGFLFDGPSWWPAPNPLLRSALKNDPGPKYRFRRRAAVMSSEEAIPYLGESEYVVVILADNDITRADQFYHRFYTEIRAEKPYALLDYFSVDAYGKLPPALVGLLGPKTVVPVLESQSLFELADDFDLSTWMHDAYDETHRDRRDAFDSNTQLTLLNEYIGYALVQVRRISEEMVQYRAVFKCLAPMERDWRVSFEASKLIRGEPLRNNLNISPVVPTSQWVPGNYYIVDRYALLPPGEYYTRIFFFDNDAGTFGDIVDPGPAQQL